MATYPDNIYSPRELKNRSGVSFDPDKKTVLFADDVVNTNNEIIAIETDLINNLRSIKDSRLYNINSLKRLLASRPDKALEFLKKYFTADAGENYCYSLTFDGSFIYAGLRTSPAKVIKINPSTMTKISTFTADSGEDSCFALTFDGSFIYAGLYISPSKVIKINPSTMERVSTFTADAGENYCYSLTFDGSSIYAGLDSSPAQVIKINPSTMTKISTFTADSGEDSCLALTFDGSFIYAGLATSPAKVIRKIIKDIDESG